MILSTLVIFVAESFSDDSISASTMSFESCVRIFSIFSGRGLLLTCLVQLNTDGQAPCFNRLDFVSKTIKSSSRKCFEHTFICAKSLFVSLLIRETQTYIKSN